ncbi:MAG: helix-turn-helix domain-containing protein [Pseudomonadota bacterium]
MDQTQKLVKVGPNKMAEISATVAAQILGVSERTVLNFIRQKQIRAVKVGKSWFVQKDSVEAFKIQRSSSMIMGPQTTGIEQIEPLLEVKPISSEPQKTRAKGFESPQDSGRSRGGVQGLNVYRLAVEIFSKEGWGSMSSSESFFMGGMIPMDVWKQRATSLQLLVLESLGAGYHSFGVGKVMQYGKARSAAGSLLALISAEESIRVKLAVEGNAISEKLLPALVALQRTAEKRGAK